MAYAQLFGLDASAVSEVNFETVFGNLLEGVFLGIDNECRVQASGVPGASVVVDTGTFITGGVFGCVSAAETVAVPAAAAGNLRCDRIVLRRTNATNLLELARVAGVEIAAPGPPVCTAPVRAAGVYEISLARVYVDDTGVVNENDITDERGEPTLCGYVSGKAYEQVARGHVEGNRQCGGWSAYGHATLVNLQGMYGSATPANQVVDDASAAVQDANGVGLQQDTSAVINTRAYIIGATDLAGANAPCHARRYWSIFEAKFKLVAITTVRLFVGLHSSNAVATVLGTDHPVGDLVGLQFQPAHLGANFQFMYELAADAVPTFADTGVVADTAAHIFRVTCRADETYMLLELLDTNRNIQASLWITGALLPGLAINMYPWSGIENLVAADRSIIQYYANGVNRKT